MRSKPNTHSHTHNSILPHVSSWILSHMIFGRCFYWKPFVRTAALTPHLLYSFQSPALRLRNLAIVHRGVGHLPTGQFVKIFYSRHLHRQQQVFSKVNQASCQPQPRASDEEDNANNILPRPIYFAWVVANPRRRRWTYLLKKVLQSFPWDFRLVIAPVNIVKYCHLLGRNIHILFSSFPVQNIFQCTRSTKLTC